MDLSNPGIWFYPDDLTASETIDFALRIEALGYSALWLPEIGGRDPFVLSALLLAHTERLVLATGIANIYARDPMAMRSAQCALTEQSAGRFVLGIGVSHQPLVEMRGHSYGPPLATMRNWLDRFDAVVYGGKPPEDAPITLLAALGPRMLELARDRVDGVHPYMVPPEHTARARKILGPDKLVCTEQKVLLEPDAERARGIARSSPAIAQGLMLPNYQNSLKRLGFDASDFDAGISDHVVDAVVAWGDASAIRERVRAHYSAGASHVTLHPLPSEDLSGPDWKVLEALAPANG